ncbi:MAG: ATP-binding protein [Acidobacteria bacterium]|nr:ATP-binding protein [Acidobacteriota bacterium]
MATADTTAVPQASPRPSLPPWAVDAVQLYESNAANQFIVFGNVNDQMVIPSPTPHLGGLTDFLLRVLLPRFDVVLSYDIGNGIRIEKGGEIFSKWPQIKEDPTLPKAPRPAIEALTHYFRYTANLARLNRDRTQVGCIIRSADLLAPALRGGFDYDLNALASLIRDWSMETLLSDHSLATFLVTENLNDLHPLVVNNPRAARIKIALPSADELSQAFTFLNPAYPCALREFSGQLNNVAQQLAGSTLGAIETLVKTREHARQCLIPDDLVKLKKQLVEKDANGLVEFIESSRTLDDIHGQEKVKAWLRQDIALWHQSDLAAMPKGYMLCGPVGTGKTFMVECLAGEARVPVVKFKNFRDKWVGSTEGNLERIFRLLEALGRSYVFVDEADQAIGRRDTGSSDSGISGRIYSMLAEEMGSSANRGKLIWIIASSRPDLIEVDLKRPGRIDVKIPLFPTTTAEESFGLIRALSEKRGIDIPESEFAALEPKIPLLLTPGAAEALAVKIYRLVRTSNTNPVAAVRACLSDYQNPVPLDTLEFQIRLAVEEASDLEFVPPKFRALPAAPAPFLRTNS